MTSNMYRLMNWIRFNYPKPDSRQLLIFIRSFYFLYSNELCIEC